MDQGIQPSIRPTDHGSIDGTEAPLRLGVCQVRSRRPTHRDRTGGKKKPIVVCFYFSLEKVS